MLNLLILYGLIWTGFHLGAGYVAQRLPGRLFADVPLVSREYGWEDSGQLYERLGIRCWKDHLPEAGAFLRGGFPKRHLQSGDPVYLGQFALETCRAECSHWLTWSLALTFFAWNPWEVGVVMLIYGAASNLPCILVQRYNRIRLRRVARTLARRAQRDDAALPAHALPRQGKRQRA